MAVNRAWYTVGGPAGVGDAKVNVELHIQVNILLFWKGQTNRARTQDEKSSLYLFNDWLLSSEELHLCLLWISSSKALTFPVCLISSMVLAFDSQSFPFPPSIPTPDKIIKIQS